MIEEEMGKVLRKLSDLALTLNALIDSSQHEGITIDLIRSQIENKTIFEYLGKFETVAGWGLGNLSKEDKWHLLGEWQSMANAIDSAKLGISNNGICLLVAYILEGIKMRTLNEEVWPGPEPW